MRIQSVVIATVVGLALATPASAATYYVSQNSKTKHCMVTTRKPKGKRITQVGTNTYKTRKEADTAMKAASECKK